MKKNIETIKNENGESHYAYVNNENANALSMEEAKKLQEELLSQLNATSDVNKKINTAAQLLLNGLYQQAIDAYNQIAKEFPEEKGVCLGQNGAAYYFLGKYEKAIECYKLATEFGADEQIMKENIEEALEAIADRKNPNAD